MGRTIDRRNSLKLGAFVAVSLVGAQASSAEQEQDRLPSSILALTSMRDNVQPITTGERQERIAKARQLMVQYKMNGILLVGGTSLAYFTGVKWGNSERLFAFIIPVAGKAFCVCPSFEEGRAREQLNHGPLEDADVLTWQENESPYARVAAGLRSRGWIAGTLGIEERTPWVFSEGIAKAAPALRFTSATPVTAGCRMIKSQRELSLMALANRATLKVYEAVYHALRPGMTQTDAVALIDSGYSRIGFRGEASVEVGPYSALPHGSTRPQVIRENEIVMIDDGCLVDGYNSDVTRTFVLGKATDKMNRVFDVVKLAQTTALAAARPGAECQFVDAAARKVITDAGFGPDYTFFSHRLGHGIGMDGHEWPYLVRGNSAALQAGMTFSDEPGIYLPGEFGIRLEDDMHVTDSGAALFTPQSPSLEVPFG